MSVTLVVLLMLAAPPASALVIREIRHRRRMRDACAALMLELRQDAQEREARAALYGPWPIWEVPFDRKQD